MTSSAVRATVGSMRTASAIAAASPEKPWSNLRTNIVKMNRPATIEGIPLMASTSTRVTLASRPRDSVRWMAVRSPSGVASRVARPTCWKLPMMACLAPPTVAGSAGPTLSSVSVKNAFVIPPRPLLTT